MAQPLEHKRRVRLRDPEDPPMPRPRRSPALGVGVAVWLAAVAVAWGVNAGTIPVARWLDGQPEAARPTPRRAPRVLPAPAPRRAPRVATSEPAAEPAPEPVPAPSVAAHLPPAEPERPRLRPEAPAASLAAAEPTPEPALLPAPAPTRAPPASPAPAAEAPTGTGSSDGLSCEAAAAANTDELRVGGDRGPADLGAADYAKVLNRGDYLSGCGVPDSARVEVCAAVRNGRAVGVTVRLTPSSPAVERCVARAVRRLAFPSHPRLDIARTRFE